MSSTGKMKFHHVFGHPRKIRYWPTWKKLPTPKASTYSFAVHS